MRKNGRGGGGGGGGGFLGFGRKKRWESAEKRCVSRVNMLNDIFESQGFKDPILESNEKTVMDSYHLL